MIKLSEIKLMKKFNLGNYETQDIGITLSVESDEDWVKVLKDTYEKAFKEINELGKK